MPVLQATNPATRHIVGDLVERFYNVSGTNGDTITVPQSNILIAIVSPTTAIAVGATVSGNVVTFVTGGAFAGTLMVISREG